MIEGMAAKGNLTSRRHVPAATLCSAGLVKPYAVILRVADDQGTFVSHANSVRLPRRRSGGRNAIAPSTRLPPGFESSHTPSPLRE
jgi:hypothetical protein